MKTFVLILTSFVLGAAFVSAQTTTGSRKAVRKPIIRATVTVKGDPSMPALPAETDAGIWNEFSTADGFIKLTFPSAPGKLNEFSGPIGDGKILQSMSAHTKYASYRLITRPVTPLLDNSEIEDVLEQSISKVFMKPGLKIVEKKNVFYEGTIGKELVFSGTRAEGKYVQFARVFILGSHLIALFVETDADNSGEKAKPWVQKFFDSLTVALPGRIHAE